MGGTPPYSSAPGRQPENIVLHYVIMTCVLTAAALASPQAELEVDYARSHIVVKAKKAGLLRFLGHEHGVVPGAWSASVVFDEQDLEASAISVEVSARELLIDTSAARALAGVDPDGPSDAEVADIRATMLSDEQLDAEQFPLIRFESSRLRRRGDGMLRLEGALTLHGILREIVFLENVELSVLTQHRTVAPYGSHGGRAGLTGNQRVIRASGEIVELRSIDGCKVLCGDRLIIETPGGGGWGEPTT